MLTGLGADEVEERLGYRCDETNLPILPFGVISEETVLLLHQLDRHPLYLRTRKDLESEIEFFKPDCANAAVIDTIPRRRLLLNHAGLLEIASGRQAIFLSSLRYV